MEEGIKDFNLTENFTFFELTRTEHRKFLEKNRKEGLSYLPEGRKLCRTLLQPIRNYYCRPLVVHSGFRCVALNRAIGGSKNSQHCLFEACDFHIVGINLKDVFDNIKDNTIKYDGNFLQWGQLILEGWSYGNPSWIHISLRKFGLEQQVLTFDGKRYIRLC